jgi:hypothetical protein
MSSFLESLFGKSSTQTVLVASAIVLTGIGIASYTGVGFSSKSSSNESSLAPAIPEEEARKIMSSILDKLHSTIPKLFRVAEQIKQQIQAQGQDIDDATLLKSFLLPHLENALKDIQDAVLAEHDVDEDELEEAVNEYIQNGDAELLKITKTIRGMFQKFGADVEEDEGDSSSLGATASTSVVSSTKSSGKSTDMSLEEFVEFLGYFAEIQSAKTEQIISQIYTANGNKIDQNALGTMQQALFLSSQK